MAAVVKQGDHLQFPTIHVEGQGNLLAVATSYKRVYRQPVGGKRGVVTEFSAGSRRRLLRLIARLEKTRTTFITLTYPAEFPDPITAKGHLRALFERIRRRVPEASGIWRLELQERGAPHFHLLMFNLPYISFETLRAWWGEIIGVIDGQPLFVRIELVRSWRGVMSYASKYVAKRSEAGQDSLFNVVAYLHAVGAIGRWWGVFQAKALPFAESFKQSVSVVTMDVMRKIKSVMHDLWHGVDTRSYNGQVMFADNALTFALLLYSIAQEYGTYE